MLAINTGRTAEIKGVMRALALVGTIREESDTVLKLNPSNVEGLVLAGGLAADLPALMGGDKTRPRRSSSGRWRSIRARPAARIELARLYIATKRWPDAQRELQGIVDEPAARNMPRWTMSDRPRARRCSPSFATAAGSRDHLPRRSRRRGLLASFRDGLEVRAGQGLSTWKAP